jgi:predicted secreted protein
MYLQYLLLAVIVALAVWGLAFTLTKPMQVRHGYAGMPAFAGPAKGRGILVKRGNVGAEVLIASVRTKSLTINGEPIDVTTDDDIAWRKLLLEPGEITVEIKVAGIAKNNTLLQEAINNTDRDQSMTFEFPGGDKLSGAFFLSNYSNSGEYKGAITFEASFASNGAIAFTVGP